MKRNIQEYKEIVDIVADIEQKLDNDLKYYQSEISDIKERDYDEQYQKTQTEYYNNRIKATQTVLDNLEKLL